MEGTRFNEKGLTKGNAEIVHLERWRIQPPRVLVRLRWTKGGQIVSVGGNTTSVTFRPNGMFDVDPTVASTVIPGFTEWGALYGINRVLACRAKVMMSNYESFPVRVSSGYFPYVIAAGSYNPTNYGNRFCKDFELGPSNGMNTRTWYHDVNITELFGNASTVGDLERFYGTTGSNPATLCSLCLGAACVASGTVFTANGVTYAIDMDFIAEFSGASTLTQLMPPKEDDPTVSLVNPKQPKLVRVDSKELNSFKFYVEK